MTTSFCVGKSMTSSDERCGYAMQLLGHTRLAVVRTGPLRMLAL